MWNFTKINICDIIKTKFILVQETLDKLSYLFIIESESLRHTNILKQCNYYVLCIYQLFIYLLYVHGHVEEFDFLTFFRLYLYHTKQVHIYFGQSIRYTQQMLIQYTNRIHICMFTEYTERKREREREEWSTTYLFW